MPIPTTVLQWKFGGQAGRLHTQNDYSTNTGYNLWCSANERFLGYFKETLGVNIGYTSDSSQRKWHFRVPDGADREITTGERVALGLGGKPSFLRYTHQPVGINLQYAEAPQYEWRIFDASGEVGKPIELGAAIAIVNDRVEPAADFLIHFPRPGVDIGWTTSPHWLESLGNAVVQQAVEAALAIIRGG